MAKQDVRILDMEGVRTKTFRVDDRDTSSASQILPGEPVKIAGAGTNFVEPLATGDPEIGTDRMVGIAASTSTETASADGEVEVYLVQPGVTVMRCAATTPANIDTDAKLRDITNDTVTFDFSSSTYTVDEDEGDDPNVHGLQIVGGDIDNGTLDFVLKDGASINGEIA